MTWVKRFIVFLVVGFFCSIWFLSLWLPQTRSVP